MLKRIWCFFFKCKSKEKVFPVPEPSILGAFEKGILDEISNYKKKQLIPVQFLSDQCYEHCLYMAEHKSISHDLFHERVKNIENMYGGYSQVNEIVAYNYSSPKGFMSAWLRSPDHKKAIDKDSDYAGVATYTDERGKRYASVLFLKAK